MQTLRHARSHAVAEEEATFHSHPAARGLFPLSLLHLPHPPSPVSPSLLPIWTHPFIQPWVSAGQCGGLRQADLILASSRPCDCPCFCVCMCVCVRVLVYHVCSPSGGAYSAVHKSMVMYRCRFYEALNNKKAISYDMDNAVGHHRHCKAIITALLLSVWFTDMPAVLKSSLIPTTFPGSERRIYRSVCLAHPAPPRIHFQGFNWYWAEVISLINGVTLLLPGAWSASHSCLWVCRCFLNCHVSLFAVHHSRCSAFHC